MTVDLVSSTAWEAGSTSCAPTYPASTAAGDEIYLYVHNKPETSTPTTPADFTSVASLTGGAGAVGGGTGATRVSIYRRTVSGSPPSGTVTVTVTGASCCQGSMRAYRPPSGGTVATDTTSSFSITSSTTDLAGTAGAGIDIASGDHVAVVVGAPDDQSTTQTVSTISASGATFGSIVDAPGTAVTSTGNDQASTGVDVAVTAGSSSAAPSITGTAASSETRLVVFHRIRGEGGASLGDATSTITASVSAAGAAESFGSASSEVTAGSSVSGTATSFGVATSAVTAGATAAGTATSFGVASSAITAGVSAEGEETPPAGLGSATSTVTATVTAAGAAASFGDVASSVTAGATAAGTATSFGSAVSAVTAGVSATGVDVSVVISGPLVAGVPTLAEGLGVGTAAVVVGMRPGAAAATRGLYGVN